MPCPTLSIQYLRCKKHGTKCPRMPALRSRDAAAAARKIGWQILTLLLAGSACTDFSSYGARQTCAGPTMFFLLVLLRIVIQYQPTVFIHENVCSFPTELLREVLHECYDVDDMLTSPTECGFPIDRKRKYCLCMLRCAVRLHGWIGVCCGVVY